jgi:hypothetical protein
LGNIKYKHVINKHSTHKHIINKESFSFPTTHLHYSINATTPPSFNHTHHHSTPLHKPISAHSFRWHTAKMVMTREVGVMLLTATWQPTQTNDEDDKQLVGTTNGKDG